AAIPPGMRAFPVQGSNVSSFIQPYDHVDVILTIKEKLGDYKSVTFLTMVEVMAVNGSLVPELGKKNDGKEPNSVTLLVTPEQAKDLELGQKQGSIRLMLRNAHDDQRAEVTKLADLKIDSTPEDGSGQTSSTPFDAVGQVQIRTIRGSQV